MASLIARVGFHRRLTFISSITLVLVLASAAAFPGTSLRAHASSLGKSARVTMGGTLTIDNESGALWTGNYSPFNGAVNSTSIGIVYEPLIYINVLSSKQTPWLATGYSWSNGNKTLTFTIRRGVTWTDGKPFTPADVAFTFNLMHRYSALDLNAVWTVLKSVQARGNTVVFTFKQQAVPYFFYIADLDAIVAQHVWGKVKNPVTYIDKHPVGTGPFVVSPSSSPQTIIYVKNPHYWQRGKPYVDRVLYPAFTSNPPANTYLAQGLADWGGQFIPSIKAAYISKDPAHFHYWFPPVGNVDLFINTTVKPLNNKYVRQALAYAIDRNRVSLIGEYGYEPPASQTDIVRPNFNSWYDAAAANSYNYGFNPAKAKALLKKGGVKGSLSLSVINIGGNTDWVAALGVIHDEFKQVGINLHIENLSSTDFNNRLFAGHFQLGYNASNNSLAAPNPYYDLRAVLCSCNTAPIGQTASSNFSRWQDARTDQLLNQFSSTTSSSVQHSIVNQLERIMLEDVPVIPVTEEVSWFQYSTRKFVGWPTPQNPYVNPAPYAFPDWEVLLLNVHLK
ncbi:MAG TPA: ABC transporter substrate-binding protein [Chloroflexota bacterium]|nr:ABC transporter substrate-binding protein [Chloroflexota bacterium]